MSTNPRLIDAALKQIADEAGISVEQLVALAEAPEITIGTPLAQSSGAGVSHHVNIDESNSLKAYRNTGSTSRGNPEPTASQYRAHGEPRPVRLVEASGKPPTAYFSYEYLWRVMQHDLSSVESSVYLVIVNWADPESGLACIAQSYLCELLKIPNRITVRRTLERLGALGLITKAGNHPKFHSTIFRVEGYMQPA